MINNIASSGVHAAGIAALRQNRATKTEPAPESAVETAKQKPAHPAHPHGHIPPGLARAAEKIASKIFSHADADASGTVTQQELSALHSKHARFLASSDLFQTTPAAPSAPASEIATDPTSETVAAPTGATPETATETTIETTTETPTQLGITEAQLKEALTKFFYAKVGVTYAAPAPPASEQLDSTAAAETITPSPVDSISEESTSNLAFTAVA